MTNLAQMILGPGVVTSFVEVTNRAGETDMTATLINFFARWLSAARDT